MRNLIADILDTLYPFLAVSDEWMNSWASMIDQLLNPIRE
jgi:hypothetical protein